MVSAVGILGCVPSILAQSTSGHCSEAVNELVIPFNENIRNMVDNLNANLPRARFIFVDVYHIFMDILNRPTQYGMCSHFISSPVGIGIWKFLKSAQLLS